MHIGTGLPQSCNLKILDLSTVIMTLEPGHLPLCPSMLAGRTAQRAGNKIRHMDSGDWITGHRCRSQA